MKRNGGFKKQKRINLMTFIYEVLKGPGAGQPAAAHLPAPGVLLAPGGLVRAVAPARLRPERGGGGRPGPLPRPRRRLGRAEGAETSSGLREPGLRRAAPASPPPVGSVFL